MQFYEILEIDANIKTRLGWIEAAQPLDLNAAARILMGFVPELAKETDVTMRAEIAVKTPDYALFVCNRKGKASLAVYEWPESGYKAAKFDTHSVVKV